jgi:hypothetical protein
MHTKLALLMDLPDGKVPGFYAQIVKALASKATLFDRDKEMLILDSDKERQAVLEIMEKYKITVEPMELALLPADAKLYAAFSDYGFTSRAEHCYLYRKLICPFRLISGHSSAEREQALQQLEEHLIAQFIVDNEPVYVVDQQLEELAQGIAKAYRCEISLV